MGSDDRFYLMEMRNRPVMLGDIGSLIRIEGLIIGGGGAQAELFLPGSLAGHLDTKSQHVELSVAEWSDWLQRSDDPEILVGPSPTGQQGATFAKIWHRKLRYEISGAVQQRIWAADGFRCAYCGAEMGKALLTVDHFIPLELSGKNDTSNYLTACKMCNKLKGSSDPESWCISRGLDFKWLEKYLRERVLK